MAPAEAPRPRHQVQLYETEAFLARTAGDFLAAGLEAGEPLVIIATQPHHRALLDELASRGFDVHRASGVGQITLLDARQVLQDLMVDEMPSRERFQAVVGGILRRAGAGAPGRVRAFGEMVDLLWRDGRRQAALRLEELWNELAASQDFSLLCAYTMANFYKEDGLSGVCALPAQVLVPESGAGPDQATTEQVRALAAEIAHRRQVEDALRALVDRLRGVEEEGRWRQEELKDFAENAVIGLHWVDAGGKVLWANRFQLDMLGYRREEYVGRSLTELFADEPAARDVLISSNAYRRDGQVSYFRFFTRDITDRKRAESERTRLVRELERTVRLNELFTAILGHDLRNPLQAMTTSAELALRRTSDERVAKPLERTLSSGRRMATMIGQLLDFTRARERGLPLERQPMDLQALAAEVRAEIELAFPGRPVEIQAEGDPRGRWDRVRLAQALSNLIGNAAQHGKQDAPVTVRLEGSSELSVRIEIHNQGVIPPEILPDVFKPFRGVEQPRERRGGSLGLGLYITEQVVRAHRGEISVTSSETAGTRFTIWLPRGGEGGSAFTAGEPPPGIPPPEKPAPADEAAPRPEERPLGVKDYAIYMLDPLGRITTWNAGAERIKGYRAEEIIGQHFSRFYPAAEVLAGKPDRELEIASRDGRFEEEGWRIRKDGSRFWADVVITALRDPAGKLSGFAKVTRDLTERHRQEEERLVREGRSSR